MKATLTHDYNGRWTTVSAGTEVDIVSRDGYNVTFRVPAGGLVTVGCGMFNPLKDRLAIELENDAMRRSFPSPHSLVE